MFDGRYLDFINIMAYDLHGAWDLQIGHNAPLHETTVDVTPLQKQLNVNASLNYWFSQGWFHVSAKTVPISFFYNNRTVKVHRVTK